MEREFIDVELMNPIEVRGEFLKVIRFYEPLGEDLLKFDNGKGDTEKAMLVASSISKIPVAEFKKMRVKDFMKCMKTVGQLMGESQETLDQ